MNKYNNLHCAFRARLHLATAVACLSLAVTASAQMIPIPPSPVSRSAVARCSSRIGSFQNQKKEDKNQLPYSPQSGWAIVSYHVVDEGSFGNTNENWTSTPGNYTFSSNTEVKNAYDSAYNLAVQAGVKGKDLADIKAQLNTSYNQYNSYHSSIANSNATIILQTNAKGRGITVDKGSQCAIHLDVVEVQADPNLRTPAQFRTFVLNKTKQAINKLPHRSDVGTPNSTSVAKLRYQKHG
jgi:hypothetical protein